MSIVAQLQDNPDTEEDENLLFGKALMLGIAYGASIGGMATASNGIAMGNPNLNHCKKVISMP